MKLLETHVRSIRKPSLLWGGSLIVSTAAKDQRQLRIAAWLENTREVSITDLQLGEFRPCSDFTFARRDVRDSAARQLRHDKHSPAEWLRVSATELALHLLTRVILFSVQSPEARAWVASRTGNAKAAGPRWRVNLGSVSQD